MSGYEPMGCFGLVLPVMFPIMSGCTGGGTRTAEILVPNKGATAGPRYRTDSDPWSDVVKDCPRGFEPLSPWPATLAPVLREFQVTLQEIRGESQLQRMVKISLGLGVPLQEGIYQCTVGVSLGKLRVE